MCLGILMLLELFLPRCSQLTPVLHILPLLSFSGVGASGPFRQACGRADARHCGAQGHSGALCQEGTFYFVLLLLVLVSY